jgi:hypothetical protein
MVSLLIPDRFRVRKDMNFHIAHKCIIHRNIYSQISVLRIMSKHILLLLITTLLISCSGETVTTRTIDNQSNKEIKFLFYRFGYGQGDTVRVAPGTEKRISLSTTDKALDEAPGCAERIDSAYVEVVGGGTLLKDISRDIFWTSTSEESDGLPREVSYECVFLIRNTDIAE